MNTGLSRVSYRGKILGIGIFDNPKIFVNEAAVNKNAIDLLVKNDDTSLRLYPLVGLNSENPKAEAVSVTYAFTEETLYKKLGKLIIKMPGLSYKQINKLISGYNGKSAYIFLITSQGYLVGKTSDGTKVETFAVSLRASKDESDESNDRIFNLEVTFNTPNDFLGNAYEVEVSGINELVGLKDVTISQAGTTNTATNLYVQVKSIEGVDIQGLVQADFKVYESDGTTPHNISGLSYVAASKTYVLAGTAFANGMLVTLATPSNLTLLVEATNSLTVAGIV